MTVESVDSEGVSCVWFDAKTPRSKMFNSDTLKKHEPGVW